MCRVPPLDSLCCADCGPLLFAHHRPAGGFLGLGWRWVPRRPRAAVHNWFLSDSVSALLVCTIVRYFPLLHLLCYTALCSFSPESCLPCVRFAIAYACSRWFFMKVSNSRVHYIEHSLERRVRWEWSHHHRRLFRWIYLFPSQIRLQTSIFDTSG